MKLRNWVKWLLFNMLVIDTLLIAIYLYMIRLIEIGGV